MTDPVTFLSIGSRGDVEPMAILAGAMAARGRPATVVAVDEYRDLVHSFGAGFRGIGAAIGEVERLGRGWLGRLAFATPLAQPLLLRRWLAGLAEPLAAALDEVPSGSLVVTGVASRDAALAVVESCGCRMATVLHTAVLPTTERDSHLEGHRFSGDAGADRAFTRWYWNSVSGLSAATSREYRRRSGLARLSARTLTARADRHPLILAADPVLLPTAGDWPATCRQTAAIRPAAMSDWTPPEPLGSLLSMGPPPVYVGLGSLNDAGGQAWLDLISEAARVARRSVLAPALPGREPGPHGDWLHTVGSLPHDELFPRLTGVVHHGGAGTTAAALRAGVPSVATPAMFDQHYHGRRLAELGVGPRPIPLRRLTLAGLIDLLTALEGSGYRDRAALIGRQARALDGTAATVAVLESLC